MNIDNDLTTKLLVPEVDDVHPECVASPPIGLGLISLSRPGSEAMIRDIVAFAPFTIVGESNGPTRNVGPAILNAGRTVSRRAVVGRFADEGMLFRLAAQMAEAALWKHLRPPQMS